MKKIAVIGGGIAGLTAAYLLDRAHQVTLFEKNDRLGGNAYSYVTEQGHKVDIAVAAFSKAGYSDFFRLLDHLGVQTAICPGAYMSFHDLDAQKGIYLTPGYGLNWRERFKLLNPATIEAVIKLYAGLRRGRQMLRGGRLQDLTVAQCLDLIPEISGNSRMIFLCVLCLLSSMEGSEVLGAPAQFFFEKLVKHNDVVSPRALYSVRGIRGGTSAYVSALTEGIKERIYTNCPISRVSRNGKGVVLHMEDTTRSSFDAVVFACNADQALRLIDEPTRDERRLLGPWRYKNGRVVVHNDYTHMPSRELMQAYTFSYRAVGGGLETSVNGALWHEHGVPDDCRYISSQHPNFHIRRENIALDTLLRTPIFDFASWTTVNELPSLNGVRNSYFCGSHFGYGLHNDAVRSAMDVARMLGVDFH